MIHDPASTPDINVLLPKKDQEQRIHCLEAGPLDSESNALTNPPACFPLLSFIGQIDALSDGTYRLLILIFSLLKKRRDVQKLTTIQSHTFIHFFDYFAWLPSENGKNRDHSGTL